MSKNPKKNQDASEEIEQEVEQEKQEDTQSEDELEEVIGEVVEEVAEENETEQLKKQIAEKEDQYLRILAEYDNYRRRSKTERENIYSDVKIETIKKFLPVYDNLLRAAEHETDKEAKQGAVAILAQFKKVLDDFGVTEIEALGKKFDPSLHNAVLHIDDEKYGEGEIVLELEKGFKLGEKVIRFSTVQVAN